MSLGLPVSDVVNVQVLLSPQAAAERNFGNLLVLGDSDIIDTVERIRLYTSSTQVAADFGINAPEYQAAVVYFAQSPQPAELYIARWASVATHGLLRGAIRSPAQQLVSNFTGINNGSLAMTVDGALHTVTNLDLTAQTNLNGVAAVVDQALTGVANVTWDANNDRFLVESQSSGSLSAVSFATAPGSGTNLGPLLGLNQVVNNGAYSVSGITAEQLADVVAKMADKSTDWYGLAIAATAIPDDDDFVAVASFIESAAPSRVFAVTIQDPSATDSSITNDLASALVAGNYRRTYWQYSSQSPVAAVSALGRAFTVDFGGTDTVITLAFKQEPTVPAEAITESQKAALFGKRGNAFLKFNNNTTILLQGMMASGDWFDAVHGTDWLQDAVQTAVYNLFLTVGTKIAQTDAGLNKILAVVSQELQQGVTNGLLYPGGVWTGPGIGTVLSTGDTLPKGYLVFAPQVATQNAAQRASRKAPLIQAAVKLSGAFHYADILISVNQ
jgi:hypothetical protein